MRYAINVIRLRRLRRRKKKGYFDAMRIDTDNIFSRKTKYTCAVMSRTKMSHRAENKKIIYRRYVHMCSTDVG